MTCLVVAVLPRFAQRFRVRRVLAAAPASHKFLSAAAPAGSCYAAVAESRGGGNRITVLVALPGVLSEQQHILRLDLEHRF